MGLPLALEFSKAGFAVAGFDIDTGKFETLRQGGSYIKHIDAGKIKALKDFSPTDDFSRLSEMDCILACVPTRSMPTGNPI